MRLRIIKGSDTDIHLVGIHGLFRWKHHLVPGVSVADLVEIQPDGFINVVRDVQEVLKENSENPKWEKEAIPDYVETQEWMMEEMFLTSLLAESQKKPFYVVARTHNISNLTDMFFTKKKKIYVSYPITSIREKSPALLEKIQSEYIPKLEELFVVFDPLCIKDMALITGQNVVENEQTGKLNDKAKEIIKIRTIERDFQFISQSDAVVVIYLTDKNSPGVMQEIGYAHRNQRPVFMLSKDEKFSPFLEDATYSLDNDFSSLFHKLGDFAKLK